MKKKQLEHSDYLLISSEAERIILINDLSILKSELIKSSENIDPDKKPQFYTHMNAVFLNIAYNRLSEFTHNAELIALSCRKNIIEIIKDL